MKFLANTKSAKKRIKVTKVKTLRNRRVKNLVKIAIKDFMNKLNSGDVASATEAYKNAVKVLDKAVTKGVLHKNNAANKKSKLALKLNKMSNASA
ncbi:30S ribosomal protein S20 [Caldanaerobius polysaccharolyticus]|nr:30S ribosomal protein S20 [Caldanaerobius polysaccharolyticus]